MTNARNLVGLWTCCSLFAAALLAGCASSNVQNSANSERPKPAEARTSYKNRQYAANPSRVKFGEFTAVELQKTAIENPHEDTGGNRKSAEKIDEMLLTGLRSIWPDIKVIHAGGEFSKSDQRTLQISPEIEHIHIVGTGGRIWGGVMAGGSDLVMHVDYRDSKTGEVIANPDFWKGNNAWSGGWTMGASDNQIRDKVVAQIVAYTAANK
jgi:hypothetical protein